MTSTILFLFYYLYFFINIHSIDKLKTLLFSIFYDLFKIQTKLCHSHVKPYFFILLNLKVIIQNWKLIK